MSYSRFPTHPYFSFASRARVNVLGKALSAGCPVASHAGGGGVRLGNRGAGRKEFFFQSRSRARGRCVRKAPQRKGGSQHHVIGCCALRARVEQLEQNERARDAAELA